MKNFYFLLIVISISFSACSDDDGIAVQVLPPTIGEIVGAEQSNDRFYILRFNTNYNEPQTISLPEINWGNEVGEILYNAVVLPEYKDFFVFDSVNGNFTWTNDLPFGDYRITARIKNSEGEVQVDYLMKVVAYGEFNGQLNTGQPIKVIINEDGTATVKTALAATVDGPFVEESSGTWDTNQSASPRVYFTFPSSGELHLRGSLSVEGSTVTYSGGVHLGHDPFIVGNPYRTFLVKNN